MGHSPIDEYLGAVCNQYVCGAPPPQEISSQASLTSGAPLPALNISLTPSQTSESEVRVQELLASPRESIIELQTQVHRWPSRRALADTLQAFSTGSQGPSSAPQSYLELSIPSIVRRGPLPLEETEWSRYQMMDLFHIDVLNFYCEKQHTQQKSLLEEEEEQQQLPLDQLRPNIVVRPPRYRWLYPILRLQEARRFVSYLTHEGE